MSNTNFYINAANSNGSFSWQGSTDGTSWNSLSEFTLDSGTTYDIQFSSEWSQTLSVLLSQSGPDYGVKLTSEGTCMSSFSPAGTLSLNATTLVSDDPKLHVSSGTKNSQVSFKWQSGQWFYADSGQEYQLYTEGDLPFVMLSGTVMVKDEDGAYRSESAALFDTTPRNGNPAVRSVVGFGEFNNDYKWYWNLSARSDSDYQVEIYSPMDNGKGSISVS